MNLHPFQRRLVVDVRRAYAGGARSVLLQSPTGSGKTHTAAAFIASAVSRGRRVLFAAHLTELVTDTAARLAAAGVRVGIVQADRPRDADAPVQVASLQTLDARDLRPAAEFVCVDEAHRSAAPTIRGLLESYPEAWLLGLSATPERGDQAPLGDIFQVLVQGPSVRELTAAGFLVPSDVLAPARYLADGLALDPVTAYERHTPGQRAIVFCANVAHAEDVTARFVAAGVAAVCITGESPADERAELRARVTAGDVRVVVNVNVAVEGFDLPALEAVIVARAASTVSSWLQMCGRGLRVSPATGKTKCTIVDLKGACLLHGVVDEDRVWSLAGAAVRRTERMAALARCKTCWAIARPFTLCPRCGARAEAVARLPRILTRAEKLERYSHMRQADRDARYLAQMERIARERIGMPAHRAREWSLRKFAERFGREPVERAA